MPWSWQSGEEFRGNSASAGRSSGERDRATTSGLRDRLARVKGRRASTMISFPGREWTRPPTRTRSPESPTDEASPEVEQGTDGRARFAADSGDRPGRPFGAQGAWDELACIVMLACFAREMPAPLSNDLRERIVRSRSEGTSQTAVAKQFAVGVSSVKRVWKLYCETGSVEPKPHAGGTPRLIDGETRGVLVGLVEAKPDATRDELCEALEQATGIRVSAPTVGRALRRENFTTKKNRSRRPSVSVRTFRRSARSSRHSSPRRTRAR